MFKQKKKRIPKKSSKANLSKGISKNIDRRGSSGIGNRIGNRINKGRIVLYSLLLLLFLTLFIVLPQMFSSDYVSLGDLEASGVKSEEKSEELRFVPIYLPTPNSVRAIYMTSWVAGTKSLREQIIKLIDETELNSIVIDIKDDTGMVSFEVEDEYLNEIGSSEVRIPDIQEFIKYLNEKDIYVIGRISVFQDPHLIKVRPDLAVKRESDGAVWRDRKGIGWLDAGSREAWEYIIRITREAHRVGFDELNFDYIRFPSDGNMIDIYYPFSEARVLADSNFGKAGILREFFAYLDEETEELGVPISADLFGMTATNKDDLNIGQILENALPYFDYISPMVYPSHYPTGFLGYQNVNAYPYEIVNFSMNEAVRRINELKIELASTTPNSPTIAKLHPNQLRPWLQDNDYPVHYTPEMVRAQINATYNAGLNSWMLWDAANTYTRAALESTALEN